MLNTALRGAVAAAGAEGPPDLPFFGQYYGGGVCGPWSAANTQIRQSSAQGQSFFFFAERTGVITQIHQHWRTYLTGYAGGDGGTYTIEIRHADAQTKLPITTGSPICSISGISPGSTAENTWKNLTHTFTTQGEVIAKQPYCLIYRNTHANPNGNYVSTNISLLTAFDDDAGADYREPAGSDPANVAAGIAAVSGWSPVVIDGTTRWYPWPAIATNGAFRYRRIGPLYAALKYADGQWVGWGAFGGGQTYHVDLSTLQLRERFRVTRATRVVSGVFVRVTRKNASSGDFMVIGKRPRFRHLRQWHAD
jgi:hypothetical protein